MSRLTTPTLDFDLRRSAFVYHGVELSRDSTLADLSQHLNGKTELTEGRPDWAVLRTEDANLNASFFFQNERLHSGHFWARVSDSTSWDDFERDEASRRGKHEEIMNRLFGAEAFENAFLRVELKRDPRTPLETISFLFG